jgi:hypothetical protein
VLNSRGRARFEWKDARGKILSEQFSSPKVCIFCGGWPLTREHVLSDRHTPILPPEPDCDDHMLIQNTDMNISLDSVNSPSISGKSWLDGVGLVLFFAELGLDLRWPFRSRSNSRWRRRRRAG